MSTDRKNEHIEYSMRGGMDSQDVFKDVHILYNSIPEVDFNKVDTKAGMFGERFDFPIIINAMTGGSLEGEDINKALALAAAEYNIPMAVGSQTIGVRDRTLRDSFTVARKFNKDGYILANVSAVVSKDTARQAIEMIEADGLQLHLNVLQELIMPEGDRDFKGILENIMNIQQSVSIPVVVKEVGFGMTKDTGMRLRNVGIRYLDIGGYGGTNFARIEALRRQDYIFRDFESIGIPTPVSLYQVCMEKQDMQIICGGGIRSGLDAAKAIIMGADAVSLAYPLLKAYKEAGESGVIEEIKKFVYELKVSMVVAGAENIESLHQKNVIITSQTLEWISGLQKSKHN